MRISTVIFVLTVVCVFQVVRAQPKPLADTTMVDAKLIIAYEGLFSREWAEKFAREWNSTAETSKALSNMGKVYFVSLAADTTSVLMEFDSLGKASVRSTSKTFPADSLPIFSSTLERWASFMEGKFKAIPGVLTRKIIFKGPF